MHRDVKPANIMILSDGRVKITDFGIAHMRTSDVRTQTGYMLGSPRYLSPEQVMGKRCDARSDVFSLGVIIYEMVTGQAPFNGADAHSLMFQIVKASPLPPSAVNSTLPPMLDLIVAKALAKAPENRYAGIADLAADLRACSRDLPDQPAPNADSTAATQRLDAEATRTWPTVRTGGESDTSLWLAVSRRFDSSDALRRLAEATGMIQAVDANARTLTLDLARGEAAPVAARPSPPARRAPEKLIVLAGITIAALIALLTAFS